MPIDECNPIIKNLMNEFEVKERTICITFAELGSEWRRRLKKQERGLTLKKILNHRYQLVDKRGEEIEVWSLMAKEL